MCECVYMCMCVSVYVYVRACVCLFTESHAYYCGHTSQNTVIMHRNIQYIHLFLFMLQVMERSDLLYSVESLLTILLKLISFYNLRVFEDITKTV